jgi:GMP synthase (glutamine-hydrolysing)
LRPVAILKAGSTLPEIAARRGDFEDWIALGLGLQAGDARVIDLMAGEPIPPCAELAAAVVTGSSAMVSAREPWSERAARWLREAAQAGTPLLGICYGHQLVAHALGGEVGPNPRGREIGTVEVRLQAAGDPLLGALPEPIVVQATHVESVLRLPEGAALLGSNDADPHHCIRFGPWAWGVQFHPEFDADVMRGYLEGRREVLIEEGLDPAALLRAVRDSDHGPAVLRRFAEMVREAERGTL